MYVKKEVRKKAYIWDKRVYIERQTGHRKTCTNIETSRARKKISKTVLVQRTRASWCKKSEWRGECIHVTKRSNHGAYIAGRSGCVVSRLQ